MKPRNRREPLVHERHSEHDDELGLSRLLWTVWENRWLLLATVALALGVSLWYLRTETPLYTATAQVKLENERNSVTPVQSAVPRFSFDWVNINSELSVLRSHDLMLATVDKLSLDDDPEFNPALRPPREWHDYITPSGIDDLVQLAAGHSAVAPPPDEARETAAAILHSKVSVSVLENTFVFNITARTEDPATSAQIANSIAEFYVAGQRDAKYEALEEAMSWLGSRVVELKEELENAESEVERFAADAALVSEGTLVASKQRLKSMRARRAALLEEAAERRGSAAQLERWRSEKDFASLAGVDDIQLRALAAELAATPSNPTALSRFDTLLERRAASLRAEATTADEQAAAAGRSVGELETDFNEQSADLVALRQLEREAEATRLLYESFLSRLKEISIQQGTQQADSQIVSVAHPPGVAAHPDSRQTLLQGGAAGLILGFGLIAARNFLRNTIQTPEALKEATGLPVIGIIPDDRTQKPHALLARLAETPTSGIAEAIRNLRVAIELSDVDFTPRLVVVTSSVPDEGKSILAAALAQSSAMAGKRVLLIDADLRRRVLRRYFRLDPRPGLVGLLSGKTNFAESVHHVLPTGVHLLSSGDDQITPVDVFASQKFASLLAAARESYDLVVLDTPPVLAVPDTRVIAQHADAIVYAVRWNSTKTRMIAAGLDLLSQVNVRVTGFALTRIDPRHMDRYGYYGYGYGYGSSGRKMSQYYTS